MLVYKFDLQALKFLVFLNLKVNFMFVTGCFNIHKWSVEQISKTVILFELQLSHSSLHKFYYHISRIKNWLVTL